MVHIRVPDTARNTKNLVELGSNSGIDFRSKLNPAGQHATLQPLFVIRLRNRSTCRVRLLDHTARGAFFDLLVDEFSPSPSVVVSRAADAYKADPTHANLLALERAVEPRRQELFRRLNMAPGGTAALVSMRTDLLKTLGAHPKHRAVDADVVHLFKSWFNRGFLTLQRINWRTSAVVLERLIQYEAVHEIQGWADLRRRLEADRRCSAVLAT